MTELKVFNRDEAVGQTMTTVSAATAAGNLLPQLQPISPMVKQALR